MKRILIIDDDEHLVGRMIDALLEKGYDVTVATTVENGLLMARHGLPNLVLLDVGLNGDCGLNLLEILRREKDGADLPVVLITGQHPDEVQPRARQLRVKECLFKPFSTTELIDTVRRVFPPQDA